MENRTIKIHEISKINAESIGSKNVPQIIHYLDTSSMTRNRIENIQILDSNVSPFPSRAQRKVKCGTIVYSTVRPEQEHFGFIEERSKHLIISTGFLTIDVIDNEIDSKYLYYLLTRKDITRHLQTIATNNVSSYPSINPSDLGNLEFVIPKDKGEQQKIAAVLSALDAKIELNTRINAELEAMAKTLYDYWFVQFDFPFDFAQGKPDADGKPYKSSGGAMVWNAALKREIPAGWEVKKIGEFGEFKNGINYDPSIQGDTDAKIINVRNISNSSLFISQYELDSINLEGDNVKKYLVTEKDILIARSGIPGATRLIFEYVENTIYCGFIIRFQVASLVHKNYLFYFLKGLEKSTTSKSGGTIMPNINQDTLKRIMVLLPDGQTILKFNNFITPIFERINIVNKENHTLAALRDWLLPLLMNGQASVE